jgi:long-chain fatty acid transport protein
MKGRTERVAAAAALAAMAAGEAGATAFQLREGSATAIGAALAGRSANDADVSLSIQNPASLRGVEGLQLSQGFAGILVYGDATANAPGQNLGGPFDFSGYSRLEDTPGVHAVVPSFAIGWRATERLVLGLAVKSPFGLATEYAQDFAGAPLGTKSELLTISITPQASFDVTPTFSVGVGLTAQYADAELAQNLPGQGEISVSGDGFAYGFVLGAIWEARPGTTIGAAFQSGFDHELDGEFSNPYTVGGAAYGGRPGKATFDLPALASIGVIQDIDEDWRVMAEFEWTGWEAFDTLTLSSPGLPDLPDPQGYENSFFISAGVEHDYSDRLTLRAGAGYDRSPTTDALRTVRTPDSDRWWLAAGLSYALTERIGVDAAYTLVLPEDTTVTRTRLGAANTDFGPDRIDYDSQNVHVFSLNLSYKF